MRSSTVTQNKTISRKSLPKPVFPNLTADTNKSNNKETKNTPTSISSSTLNHHDNTRIMERHDSAVALLPETSSIKSSLCKMNYSLNHTPIKSNKKNHIASTPNHSKTTTNIVFTPRKIIVKGEEHSRPPVSELKEWWEHKLDGSWEQQQHSLESSFHSMFDDEIESNNVSVDNEFLNSIMNKSELIDKTGISIECITKTDPQGAESNSSGTCLKKHEIKLTCRECKSCIVILAAHSCQEVVDIRGKCCGSTSFTSAPNSIHVEL